MEALSGSFRAGQKRRLLEFENGEAPVSVLREIPPYMSWQPEAGIEPRKVGNGGNE